MKIKRNAQNKSKKQEEEEAHIKKNKNKISKNISTFFLVRAQTQIRTQL